MHTSAHQSGQTLLEVIIAIAIIAIGMMSLISLLINTQITGANTQDEFVVIELGREAIEAARFVRDSNWLAQENGQTTPWNAGLRDAVDPTDYTGIYVWTPAQTNPALALAFNFLPDVSTHAATKVYRTPAGYYQQMVGAVPSIPPNNWTATPYSRFVTFYPICSSTLGVTESFVSVDGTVCATTQIGVQVVVTIQWSSRGTPHTRTFEERLYNWKYAQ